VKQMMIFAYDCKGVIVTDRVPSGMTVTVAYYYNFFQKLRHKMHANRPDLLENGVMILHDNTRPQLGKDVRELLLPHPPYSHNMSPPGFDPFPKLKINMCGVLFSTLEDLSASVTRRVVTAQLLQRPDGCHGPYKSLGCSHSAEGGLHRRTITLHRTFSILLFAFLLTWPT
jgi:hypothetical protein